MSQYQDRTREMIAELTGATALSEEKLRNVLERARQDDKALITSSDLGSELEGYIEAAKQDKVEVTKPAKSTKGKKNSPTFDPPDVSTMSMRSGSSPTTGLSERSEKSVEESEASSGGIEDKTDDLIEETVLPYDIQTLQDAHDLGLDLHEPERVACIIDSYDLNKAQDRICNPRFMLSKVNLLLKRNCNELAGNMIRFELSDFKLSLLKVKELSKTVPEVTQTTDLPQGTPTIIKSVSAPLAKPCCSTLSRSKSPDPCLPSTSKILTKTARPQAEPKKIRISCNHMISGQVQHLLVDYEPYKIIMNSSKSVLDKMKDILRSNNLLRRYQYAWDLSTVSFQIISE